MQLQYLRKQLERIDLPLLLFLLLFMDVKLAVKVVAILLIYILRWNTAFRFSFKNTRLPLFYPAVIIIAIVNYLVYRGFANTHYSIAFITGIAFWVLCILACHQVKLAVDMNEPQVIHNTLFVFFVLNMVVSFAKLGWIMWDAGSINPYRYQGMYQKYFIGTGDLIRGIAFDTSTTNALINACGVIYFITRGKAGAALLCMIVLLLTGSNSTNILLLGIFILLLVRGIDNTRKSVLLVCCIFLVVFMAKVSPQNNTYAMHIAERPFVKLDSGKHPVPVADTPLSQKPDIELSPEERREKIAILYLDSVSTRHVQQEKLAGIAVIPTSNTNQKPLVPKDNIHSATFQHRSDSVTASQAILTNYLVTNKQSLVLPEKEKSLPGKAIAGIQLYQFFRAHPEKLLTGDGMGNFSSKLAFKTTALNIDGSYPKQLAYISPDFRDNHLAIYAHYFSMDSGLHSVAYSPDSVYYQLAGEYGIMGLAVFLFGYVLYFYRRLPQRSYGIPLLFLLCGAFFIEYWFEQ